MGTGFQSPDGSRSRFFNFIPGEIRLLFFIFFLFSVFPFLGYSQTATDSTISRNPLNSGPPVIITCPPGSPFTRTTVSGHCYYTVQGTEFNPAYSSGVTVVNNFNFTNTLANANIPKGTTIITWTATDSLGSTATCSITVIVNDNQAPAITCPAGSPFTRGTTASSGCFYKVQGTEFNPLFSDNCPGTTIQNNFNNTNTLADADLPLGQTIVTWTATDASGMIATCMITVIVIDDDPPAIICPPDITVPCPDSIPDPNVNLVTATDNCGFVTVIHVNDNYVGLGNKPGFCPTSVERTYRATDAAGNSVDCMQIITVAGECGCVICQSIVPHFFVNLSGHCDSTWTSPSIERLGKCCDANGSDRCISFSVKIDNNAIGFYILIDGAAPPGHYYQVDCGDQKPLSDLICIPPGGQYHTVTICKPGGNANVYQIRSVCGLLSPDSISTRANCSRELTVSGVIESTVTWNDITGGGIYNQYLSCTSGCLTTIFNPDSLAPSIIKYLVCGEVSGNSCTESGIVCDTVVVHVFPEVKISIYPDPPTFCIYDPKTIYAAVSPSGTYNIKWWDGPNGTGNIVSTSYSYTPQAPGLFSITVAQVSSTLPCSEDTINFEISLSDCILSCPQQYHCDEEEIIIYSTVSEFIAAGGVISFPYQVEDENIMLTDEQSDNNSCPEIITHTYLIWDILGNSDVCNEIITIDDTIPPVFTVFQDTVKNCVQDIVQAFWDFMGDITPIRPDWYTFIAGNTLLDLNPSTFSDNCTVQEDLILHWKITLVGGTIITGSGQVSTYNSDIQFPLGDNIITYWLEDNCGNLTPPGNRPVAIIRVLARPDITRNF